MDTLGWIYYLKGSYLNAISELQDSVELVPDNPIVNYHLGNTVIVHHGGGSSQHKSSNFSILMMRESVSRFLRKSRGEFYSSCYRLTMTGVAIIRLALLGVLFPSWLTRRKTSEWNAIFGKWFATLRWGLGLEEWIRSYNQFETSGVGQKGGEEKSCAEFAEN